MTVPERGDIEFRLRELVIGAANSMPVSAVMTLIDNYAARAYEPACPRCDSAMRVSSTDAGAITWICPASPLCVDTVVTRIAGQMSTRKEEP